MTTQELFDQFINPSTVFTDDDKDFLLKELPRIKRRYDQWHRKYHNWDHVVKLIELAFGANQEVSVIPTQMWFYLSGHHSMKEPNIPVVFESYEEAQAGLLVTILYHDVVYNQMQQEGISERLSAIFFLRGVQEELEDRDSFIAMKARYIVDAIKETSPFKEPTNPLSTAIRYIDQYHLIYPEITKQVEYLNRLRVEYRHIPFEEFLIGNKKFLHDWLSANIKLVDGQSSALLRDAVEILSKTKPTVGIYEISGSIFHMGHWSVVEQAMKMFDRVLILLKGGNREFDNSPHHTAQELQEMFPFINFWGKQSKISDIVDALGKTEHPILIKSIRNSKDLEYELGEFDILNEQFDDEQKIPSVFIPVSPKYRHLNQTLVKRVWVHNGGVLGGNPNALINLVPSMRDLGYSQEELDEMLLGSRKTIDSLLDIF